jgi:hypothetical protein
MITSCMNNTRNNVNGLVGLVIAALVALLLGLGLVAYRTLTSDHGAASPDSTFQP